MKEPRDIGPQNPGDERFVARMRFHQSWFRANELGIDYGEDEGSRPLGNFLQLEDARRGRNFASVEIAALAKRCAALNTIGFDRHRLLHNLLSSQPMCFNPFGPIVLDQSSQVRFVEALTDRALSEVTKVEFEYAPEPRSMYLKDGTAFDVFIEFRTRDGELGFVGIEVKLSEPFSKDPYPLSERPAYQYWVNHASAPWEPSHRDELDMVVHNQLWRDHMLAVALKEASPERYASGDLYLIRHPQDTKTSFAVDGYHRLLKESDTTFTDMPLDHLIARWKPLVSGSDHEPWLAEFERRYVDLAGSDAQWRELT